MSLSLHRKIPGLRRPFLKLDAARAKRNAALAERNAALAERDAALAERNAALAERDAALAERNAALAERNATLARSGCASGTSSLWRIEGLRTKPWYTVDLPPEVASVVGMISADERRLLYTLARDYYTGAGRIIDGGAYLGSSSLSLGWGLKDQCYPKEPVIDAFDTFIIDAHSIAHHFKSQDAPGREIKDGDNVRFVYEGNVASVAEYIRIHEGDLLQMTWSGEPIEIIFSDVAKGWKLNDYITLNWISALLPETGILIHQDQVQEYHVWVAITMEILADFFEIIDYTVFDSMVYRLKKPIPARVLHKCLSANISTEEMEYYYLSWVERFRRMGMGRYKGWTLGMVEAGLVVTYGFHIGDLDKAWYALRECEAKFRHIPDTMGRLAQIKRHLEERTPCPGSRLYL